MPKERQVGTKENVTDKTIKTMDRTRLESKKKHKEQLNNRAEHYRER